MQTDLPIWQLHAEIVATLEAGNRLVLVAPTGSGKTTQVPQMLLDSGLLGAADSPASTSPRGGRKIVVLQPRRVAARTVAARVAWERRGKLGDEVGYQIRFDDLTSLGTRICFVTEGILLRWLQDDPDLPEVGAVLFDEFHERNLLSDVALALVKQIQENRRPDLKMVVMSATLDAEPVAAYLGSKPSAATTEPAEDDSIPCPILVSEGRSFGVEIRYLDSHDERPLTEQAATAVAEILRSGAPGDVLVFMPGMGEINGTINACRAASLPERVAFIPLHGELEPTAQDLAFAPNSLRKVVVSTNVAETSVTIDGIRHVVDGGQARVARYDADRGISTLFIEEISRASAEQRAGRAGRTAPGVCRRLWTESGHLNRPERNTPEIQRADLAEVVLLLHSLGIKRAAKFDWLDKPDPVAVERAEKLLTMLGALRPSHADSTATADAGAPPTRPAQLVEAVTGNRHVMRATSDLTPIGRQMLRLPMHPRFSRMLVEAGRRECVPAAALCAALVSGRDLLTRLRRDDKHIAEARELFEASQLSDFFTLMRAYEFARKCNFNPDQCRRYGINGHVARQVEQTFEQLVRLAEQQRLTARPKSERELSDADASPEDASPASASPRGSRAAGDDGLLLCLTAGFIDQLCRRRDQGTLDCDLTEGRTGTVMRESVVQNSQLMVAATIRETPSRGSENLTLLGLLTAVKREWLEELFPQHIHVAVEHLFDRTQKRVAAVKLIRFADLVIHHEHQRELDDEASGRCLAEAYRKGWFELPLFNHELKQFIGRVNLVCAVMPELEFPPLDDAAITRALGRAFAGLTLAKEAQATHLQAEFARHLAPEQRTWLDELAPTSLPWAEGRKLKLLYAEQARDDRGELNPPEAQVKLHECFPLTIHPAICEGKLPVKLWLCSPDGKRIEPTVRWPAFKTTAYPKLKGALQKKFPSIAWI